MNVRAVNETHDPSLRSWVASANSDHTDFPIQNLPFGAFRRAGTHEAFRGGIAIGDAILDLAALEESGIFWGDPAALLAVASRPPLNEFMALGHDATHVLRSALVRALSEGSPVRDRLEPMLVLQADAEMALPASIGDYTDFYSSIHHATAVGKLFRPDAPLTPNYTWLPIGYHGRASSIVVSGTPIAWPSGQRVLPGDTEPVFGPSKRLDYEAELGIFIGRANALGSPIAIADAEAQIFGLCILNDWSARDIQAWEYQPLGPFLGKSFATTISPWIVTLEALAPFRAAWPQPQEPVVLRYLAERDASTAAIDVRLSTSIASSLMRDRAMEDTELARASYASAYWTAGQLVAHHTSNGCNLRSGDLLGTGTISGPLPAEAGSLLELSKGGTRAIAIGAKQERRFLEDGDRIVMHADAMRENFQSIGFGFASGIVSRG